MMQEPEASISRELASWVTNGIVIAEKYNFSVDDMCEYFRFGWETFYSDEEEGQHE